MTTPAISVVALLALPACAPMPARSDGGQRQGHDPCADQAARMVGAAAGAILGALLAQKMSGSKYALPVGAIVGAVIGQAIGKDVAKRQCDVYLVAKRNNLEFVSVSLKLPSTGTSGSEEIVGLSATLIDKEGTASHFQSGSDQLTPAAKAYFSEIAAAYLPSARKAGLSSQESALIDSSKVLIVGHTDDEEDSASSAELSERRAKAVAAVFRDAGVPEPSIYYQGAGETLPIANNRDEAGRARNRRVEIVDVANDRVMAAYLNARVSTFAYFRPVVPVPERATTVVAARPVPKIGKKPTPDRANRVGVLQPKGSPAQLAAVASVSSVDIDFGGAQFNHISHQVSIGDPVQSFGFSLLPIAFANEMPPRSCVEDRPRVARSVKSLRGASEYKTGEYQPGAFGTSWNGKVNGHLVSLNNVAVLRAGGLPAANPNVLVFKNFDSKGSASRKADYTSNPSTNSYSGTKGTLYRVFFEKGAPLRCIDVVLPTKPPFRAEQGFVYQEKNQHTFATDFKPEVPPRKM